MFVFTGVTYYSYDIPGKVNQVSYQPGQGDAYYHKYSYDAENRLTDVYTGRDSTMLLLFPEREAHYSYYKHAPLMQTILGQLQVQKQDYAYTLQGWLKSVNPDSTISGVIAKNVCSFVLDYYNNDYRGIGVGSPSAGIPSQLGADNKQLFNGNISSMGINIPQLGNSILCNYQYDQLNRLVSMDAWKSTNNVWGGLTKSNSYKERFSYNPDGGITTLIRHGSGATVIDSAVWNYYTNTHRVEHISDPAGRAGWDAGNQSVNNYSYDAIGEMTGDNERGLTNTWTVYGKLKTQTIGSTTITYIYDAGGNRISKQLSNGYKEFYVRDASGNVMSIYRSGDTANSGHLTQAEAHLYGSSRLGINKPNIDVQNIVNDNVALTGGFAKAINRIFTRGNKFFELNEHRGNNLVTISDRRLQQSSGGITVDYYTADIKTAQDYSSFGSLLQGRQFGSTPRYTYNGKQLDTETGWQDYGMRNYLVDVPIFGSVDPITKKYPDLTPYQFASNTPIQAIDLDGAEALFVHGTWSDKTTWGKEFTKNMLKATGWDKIQKQALYGNWSGGNNDKARQAAAEGIYDYLVSDKNPYRDLKHATLIGHSHGGNVDKIVKSKLEMDGWVVDIINIETPQRKDYQSAKTGPGVYLNFYSNNDLIQKLGAAGSEGPLGARKDPKADANIPLVESIPITIPGQPLPANKIVTWFKDSGGHSLQNNELSNSIIVDQTKKAFDASLEKPTNLKKPTNGK